MTTATEIRAQLAEAWENAERVAPQEGDTYITRYDTLEGHYSIGVARWELDPSRYRVLERAKPKPPEWEAVVASYLHSDDHKREVYFRTTRGEWESETRLTYADELVGPVPLVELPEREALVEAIHSASPVVGPVEGGVLADAVLELLKRR